MRWLLCGVLLLGCAGCGLSGGSVPIGRPPAIAPPGSASGTVIHAVAPSPVAPGADITIVDSSGQPHTAVADKDGAFTINGVAPGQATVSAGIAATPGHPRESVQFQARFDSGKEVSMVLSLVPEGVTPGAGGGPTLPAGGSDMIHVGTSQSYPAISVGSSGQPLTPSYVVEGGIGTISPDGTFHATTAGTGTLRVILGGMEDSQTIVVGQ